MAIRFLLVCPKCKKVSAVFQEQREPQPTVSCGDCLMDRVEVVRMKVVSASKDLIKQITTEG